MPTKWLIRNGYVIMLNIMFPLINLLQEYIQYTRYDLRWVHRPDRPEYCEEDLMLADPDEAVAK